MPLNDPMTDAIRLHACADDVAGRAAAARTLSTTIERRRVALGGRLGPCTSSHVPEIWSSRAADVSRVILTREIGMELWLARERLIETRLALERKAEEYESRERWYRERAREAEVGLYLS